MASQWFVKVQGKQAGPLASQQLKTLAEQGKISPDDLVRQESGGSWIPARKVKGLFGEGDSQADPPTPTSQPVAAEPQSAPPMGIQVVSESPTERVMARCATSSSRRSRAPNNKTVVTTLVVLLVLMSGVGIAVMVIPRGGTSSNEETTSPSAKSTAPEADDIQESGKVVLEADGTINLEKLGILATDDEADKKPRSKAGSTTSAAEAPSRTAQANERSSGAESSQSTVAESDGQGRKAATAQVAGKSDQDAQTMPDEEPTEAASQESLEGVDKIAADIAALGGGEDSGLEYNSDEMSGAAEKDDVKRRNPPAKKPAD